MRRLEQYRAFNIMVTRLLAYMIRKRIPFRLGEAHRPFFVAQKYHVDGVGIMNSKHRYSLAVDIWITTESGKGIMWEDDRYSLLGIYWEKMGGIWGGRFRRFDPYHFEFKEKPS